VVLHAQTKPVEMIHAVSIHLCFLLNQLFVEKTATIEVAATMELVHVMSIGQVQLVTLLFVLRAVKHMGHATMAHASVTRDIVVLTV
jgi:hypothetical protein